MELEQQDGIFVDEKIEDDMWTSYQIFFEICNIFDILLDSEAT